MKKLIAFIAVIIIGVIVYLLFINKKEKKPENENQQPLTINAKTDAFNKPFSDMLSSYYSLKDALVEWDTAKAARYATTLASQAEKIPFQQLKGDSTLVLTAKSFAENVSAESKGVAGENTIEGQRRSFYTLSENLYNLIRTVHYDQAVIYHIKCPMAFNDNEEAYWLSNSNQIINPYLGKKHPRYHSGMLGCGNIEDSIDFRQK